MTSSPTIGIIGAGAWGTALAQSLSASGARILLYAREPSLAQTLSAQRENPDYLPGIRLSPAIEATADLERCAKADILLLVTPAQHVRSTLISLTPFLSTPRPLILCAKGIEVSSGRLLSDIAKDILPQIPIGILSGPTFARDIAQGLPGAATLAMPDTGHASELAQLLGNRNLRLYPSDDVVGAEVGGAVKNVIAIASGIVTGRGLGDTARAALVTRGLAEIVRLAVAMGGRRETLMGLCGMGDLILTATSLQSRNYSLGVALGQGRSLADILSERRAVTEGVQTARAVETLAIKQAIDMPLCTAMSALLWNNLSINDAIDRLLNRPVPLETL